MNKKKEHFVIFRAESGGKIKMYWARQFNCPMPASSLSLHISWSVEKITLRLHHLTKIKRQSFASNSEAYVVIGYSFLN